MLARTLSKIRKNYRINPRDVTASTHDTRSSLKSESKHPKGTGCHMKILDCYENTIPAKVGIHVLFSPGFRVAARNGRSVKDSISQRLVTEAIYLSWLSASGCKALLKVCFLNFPSRQSRIPSVQELEFYQANIRLQGFL
jgi:hypothetical protein